MLGYNHFILSICIPCYGRTDYVRNTLKSIFIDNADVPLNEYEVVISDNDPKQEIKQLAVEFQNYDNLRYYHTVCEGFMNSYYVLTYGNGEFLKLHNSQTLFKKGSLRTIIDEIKKHLNSHSLIFYTNGLLHQFKSNEYDTFNDFMYHMSYWSSWSNGFNIWKDDFKKLGDIKLNKLFPHTSILLTQNKAKKYCIDDTILFDVQRIPKRGGHNKFEAFTIEYPSLIDDCYKKGNIDAHTRKHILKGIMYEFLPSLVFNKYIAKIETFESTGFKENIKVYFPSYSYYLVLIISVFQPTRLFFRRLLNYIKS